MPRKQSGVKACAALLNREILDTLLKAKFLIERWSVHDNRNQSPRPARLRVPAECFPV